MQTIKKVMHQQQWYNWELRMALETVPVLHPHLSTNPLKWKYKAREVAAQNGRTKNAIENQRARYKGEVLSRVA